MKRITNRKFRLGFVGKLYDKNGKEVSKVITRIKHRLLSYIEASSIKEGHMFISVNYGDNFVNASDHKTKASAIKALNAYTEKQLLDDI